MTCYSGRTLQQWTFHCSKLISIHNLVSFNSGGRPCRLSRLYEVWECMEASMSAFMELRMTEKVRKLEIGFPILEAAY